MIILINILFFLLKTQSVYATTFSCAALNRFANEPNSHQKIEREKSILEIYTQILKEITSHDSSATILDAMLKSKEPFKLPPNALLDSDTTRDSLQQMEDLIASDLANNPELKPKLVSIIRQLIGKTKTGIKRARVADAKAHHRFVFDFTWPNHVYRSYLHNGWVIGFPNYLNEGVNIQLTRDGKTIEKIAYQKHLKPRDGDSAWISPHDGNILFFDVRGNLFRIPLFDSQSKPLKQTEAAPVKQVGILPLGEINGLAKLYFSQEGDRVIRTLLDRKLLVGRFTDENTLNYELELTPKTNGEIGPVQWFGNSHLLLIDKPFTHPSKRHASVFTLAASKTGRAISKLSHGTGDYFYASNDGLDLYQLQYTGTKPKAQRLRDVNGNLNGNINQYKAKPISLGHTRRFRLNEGNPLIDELYFPGQSDKVIQLFFHRDGTRTHDLILKNRDTFKEIGRITLPVTDVVPEIEMSPDKKFMVLHYESLLNEKSVPRTIVIDTSSAF